MKHQISKVALIATLAFIGVGFAGTQQAKATNCPPDNCNLNKTADDCGITLPAKDAGYEIPGTIADSAFPASDDDLGCLDCSGNCVHDDRAIVTTRTFWCLAFNEFGDVFTEKKFNPDTQTTEDVSVKQGFSTSKTAHFTPCESFPPIDPNPPRVAKNDSSGMLG